MFIGEGPGAEEDAQGRPFVGPAGTLLDKQIIGMGLTREQVYIANIAKTRPPGNRVPTPDEADRWMPWLVRQIEIIGPRVIVALGATSAKYLLNNPDLKITRDRGQWCSFRGIDLMCTFHPAYLLRSYTVDNRRRVWDDLKKVLERLGLPVPGKG
jgi:DNA polymerase